MGGDMTSCVANAEMLRGEAGVFGAAHIDKGHL